MTQYTELNYAIEKTDNNGIISYIPKDESNADYKRYLNPEAEQSTPPVIE